MIRKSTWEAYFKHPKTFSLPSNWQEPGVFFLHVCHIALVTGTTRSLQKEKKKKKKLLHSSSSTNTAWRLLCGDLCDWARCLPVTHPGADGQRGSSPWFPPQPTLRPGTFSTSSSGKAGNWLFLWNEHDPEEHWAWAACALERVLSCTSHHQASELLFIRGQPEPGDRRTATDLWQRIATLLACDSTWEVREITFS